MLLVLRVVLRNEPGHVTCLGIFFFFFFLILMSFVYSQIKFGRVFIFGFIRTPILMCHFQIEIPPPPLSTVQQARMGAMFNTVPAAEMLAPAPESFGLFT